MKKKITIIGRGVDPAKHLSLAALRALRQADKVIGIEPEKEAWQELRLEFGVPEIEDISHLYENGSGDLDNYERFIHHILALSERHVRLALLVAGHPRLGVTFLQLLSEKHAANVDIEVIEAISSFDVMMNDLALDPLERGTALVDANRMLLFQYDLEPSLSYFIYHVCSVGNSKTEFVDTAQGNRLDLLKTFLLKTYQADKELLLCKAANGSAGQSALIRFELAELERMAPLIDFGTTLYIPAEKPSRLDRRYLALLR